ncbi:MAG: single-stranded DNA-binding protein [Anaeroplasma sp.]
MYNYFMLIGTIVDEIELKEVANNKKVIRLRLAVRKEFRNTDGEFGYDFFNINLWDLQAEIAAENFKKGSKIGIKGRIYPKKDTNAQGYVTQLNELIVDRLIFFDDFATNDNNIEAE